MRSSNVLRGQQTSSNTATSSTAASDSSASSSVPQVSVQPTIVSVVGPTSTVAPSTSSAVTGIVGLNPSAAEFLPRSPIISTGTSSPATSSTTLINVQPQPLEPTIMESADGQLPIQVQGASSQQHRTGQKAAAMVPPRQSSEDSSSAGPTPSTSGTATVSVAPKRRREDAEIEGADAQKKPRQEAVASPWHKNESPSSSGPSSLVVASPSTPSRGVRLTEPATSTIAGEDDDIVLVDSNSSEFEMGAPFRKI